MTTNATEHEVDERIRGWFLGRIPDGWFTAPPVFEVDRDEIIVWGELPVPEVDDDESEVVRREAERSRIAGFRGDSRKKRIEIARGAEHEFERKVSWGVVCGETRELFTHLAAPAMTRLRMPERMVLDTLIHAGVARSRSDALAWCVRLVGRNQGEWLAELDDALRAVHDVRQRGPQA